MARFYILAEWDLILLLLLYCALFRDLAQHSEFILAGFDALADFDLGYSGGDDLLRGFAGAQKLGIVVHDVAGAHQVNFAEVDSALELALLALLGVLGRSWQLCWQALVPFGRVFFLGELSQLLALLFVCFLGQVVLQKAEWHRGLEGQRAEDGRVGIARSFNLACGSMMLICFVRIVFRLRQVTKFIAMSRQLTCILMQLCTGSFTFDG